MLNLLLAFFVGVSDLTAEMLVLRSGRFGLGASASATALLLSLALAGFAVGAAFATRFGGARRFALWRIVAGGAGALGAWLPLTLAGSETGAPVLGPAVSILVALTFLVPSGLSLPALYSWAGASPSRAAALLASNTLGAVGGVFVGALFGPLRLGTSTSSALLVALNLALALSGFLSSRRLESLESRAVEAPADVPAVPRAASWRRRFAGPLVSAGAGFATLALEAIGLRLTPFFLEERSDAIACVVAGALVGIALGMGLAGFLLRRMSPVVLLGFLLAALSFTGPVGLLLLDGLGRLRWLSSPTTPSDWAWARAAFAGAFVLPLVVAVGALSPVAYALTLGTGRERAAKLNLAFSAGALVPAAGLPILLTTGVSTTFVLGAIGCVALAAGFAVFGSRLLPLVFPVAAGAVLGLGPLTDRVPPFRGRPWLECKESLEGPIGLAAAVLDERRQEWTLFTNAFRAAATGDDYRYTRALAHLPALLARRSPERIAVIAVGTGSTAAAALRHRSTRELELVEISEEVFRLLPWFRPASDALFPGRATGAPSIDSMGLTAARPSLDARVRCVVEDGRRHLTKVGASYDLLLFEPLLPDTPAAFPFYTREFYRAARRRLAEGGVLAQWIPVHATAPRSFRALVATFAGSFPHRAAFLSGKSLILLGSDAPLALAPGRLADATQDLDLAIDLRRAGCASPGDVAAQCCLGNAGLATFEAKNPLEDDRASIERIGFLPGESLLTFERENLETIVRAREGSPNDEIPGLDRLPAGEREARRDAGLGYVKARHACVLEDLRQPLDADASRALASLEGTMPHPFASLDAFRRQTLQSLTEARTLAAKGEIQAAQRLLERVAPAARDPLAWILLGVCHLRSERTSDAAFAASVAFALDAECDEGLLATWRETRETKVVQALVKLKELAAPLLGRRSDHPRDWAHVAEGLTSSDVLRRVESQVALARHRDSLSIAVEIVAEGTTVRTPREIEAAALLADALADPTLAPARAKLRAARAR